MTRMGWYSRNAGEKLSKLLAMAEALPQEERMTVAAEIDAARVLAADAFETFELACIDEKGSAKASPEMKIAAKRIAMDSMSHVAGLVEKHCRIVAQQEQFVNVFTLEFVLEQTMRIVDDALVGHENIATLIKDRMSNIHVPKTTERKVVITI